MYSIFQMVCWLNGVVYAYHRIYWGIHFLKRCQEFHNRYTTGTHNAEGHSTMKWSASLHDTCSEPRRWSHAPLHMVVQLCWWLDATGAPTHSSPLTRKPSCTHLFNNTVLSHPSASRCVHDQSVFLAPCAISQYGGALVHGVCSVSALVETMGAPLGSAGVAC